MRLLGNILWIITGGFITSALYFLGGLILCITIIGIPFGVQVFKIAELALMPFGKQVTNTDKSDGCLTVFMNILWIFIIGLKTATCHIVFGAILCITIIGIPFGKQHFKLAALALIPFGRKITSI